MAEALLFAAAGPLDEATLRKRMPKTARVPAVLAALEDQYRNRGVNLKKVAGRWAFVTAPDMQHLLEEHRQVQRKLSRAAIETLAIIAYHQPCTRAEIEEIRGVSISKGTLDVLMERSEEHTSELQSLMRISYAVFCLKKKKKKKQTHIQSSNTNNL